MTDLPHGLFETLITRELAARLAALPAQLGAVRQELEPAELPERLARHFAEVLRRALEERELPHARAILAELLQVLARGCAAYEGAAEEALAEEKELLLRAIAQRLPGGAIERVEAPLLPLVDTALLTPARGEPAVGHQIESEARSADRIDVLMAFVRWSGIVPLREALRRHRERGRRLRLLTTTYTGTTELRALEALRELGAEIKVSYDTSRTRLHAKAWLFHRESGFSTAYIGSSNLTHAAQVTGLEWNLRVSGAQNPAVLAKFEAVFETYWNSGDFVAFHAEEFRERVQLQRASGAMAPLLPFELRLEPFQERLLEQIAFAREEGRHANLLVAATGTGKTVMAAIDYRRWRKQRLEESAPAGARRTATLLFVAHRKEILEQSRATFRAALREPGFGELWVDGQVPVRFEQVFASIQTLRREVIAGLDPRRFDYVVIDEFHHAAAPSYEALIEHLRPVELLGLTATPERSDGLSVLRWFGERIAAELRLGEAIEQGYLTPFAYYGISDGTDLSRLPWRRGRGYEPEALTKVYTAHDAWARLVVDQVLEHIGEPQRMRALGFCASVAHARHTARFFDAQGLPAVAISAETPEGERRAALARLARGELRAVFSVDLFNEGVDVPDVDTLLFLRPTESPTLFLQQLGRGLRRADGKALCTVLDFVGRQHAEFRFDRKLGALLGGTRRELEEQLKRGFPLLPAGCTLKLDGDASAQVLQSLRRALPSRTEALQRELSTLARSGERPTLARFLRETGLTPEELYANGQRSFTALLRGTGLLPAAEASHAEDERGLLRACARILHWDDHLRLGAARRWLAETSPPPTDLLTTFERRLFRLLVSSLVGEVVAKGASLDEGAALLWSLPQVRSELAELLPCLEERLGHRTPVLSGHPEVPLRIHARYTRGELAAALGLGAGARAEIWQPGVRWIPAAGIDLFTFTLDKTKGNFSPTTRYRDYAISRELIHWESQSMTRADSETGRRYRDHLQRGSSIFLCARLDTTERAFTFLGPADYVSSAGERPIRFVWKLRVPLPEELFAAYAAAVA
jgi:superfamily II DNA or RNA helicase/HKD family nuclease